MLSIEINRNALINAVAVEITINGNRKCNKWHNRVTIIEVTINGTISNNK
jgi:hypothetical protein